MTQKIIIDLLTLFNTSSAKSAWKKYREFIKSDSHLTSLQKKQKHQSHLEFINALSQEPEKIRMKIGELLCNVICDGNSVIDNYTQQSIHVICNINLKSIESMIIQFLFKDYDEKNAKQLFRIAQSGYQHPDPLIILPPYNELLKMVIQLDPNHLACKQHLFFAALQTLTSVISWPDHIQFFDIGPDDFQLALSESMHWANELNQQKIWEKIVKKAQLYEISQAIKNYFQEAYPHHIYFNVYLKTTERYRHLSEEWPKWFGFLSTDASIFQMSMEDMLELSEKKSHLERRMYLKNRLK